MGLIFSALKKFLFWSYERGSWQYDLLCAAILAFIFIGPNQIFHSADGDQATPTFVEREKVGVLDAADYDRVISDFMSKRDNRKVKASKIVPMFDNEGKLTGYLINEIKQ